MESKKLKTLIECGYGSIKMIKELNLEMNISAQMYWNNSYKDNPITVRLYDNDAKESIVCIICKNRKQAEEKFSEITN